MTSRHSSPTDTHTAITSHRQMIMVLSPTKVTIGTPLIWRYDPSDLTLTLELQEHTGTTTTPIVLIPLQEIKYLHPITPTTPSFMQYITSLTTVTPNQRVYIQDTFNTIMEEVLSLPPIGDPYRLIRTTNQRLTNIQRDLTEIMTSLQHPTEDPSSTNPIVTNILWHIYSHLITRSLNEPDLTMSNYIYQAARLILEASPSFQQDFTVYKDLRERIRDLQRQERDLKNRIKLLEDKKESL